MEAVVDGIQWVACANCGDQLGVVGGGSGYLAGLREVGLSEFLMEIYSKVVPNVAGIG